MKKITDESNEIKSKLIQLQKKDSPSFLSKDLGDLVYEKKINKDQFVNTYMTDGFSSELLVTILVVVNKKNIQKF